MQVYENSDVFDYKFRTLNYLGSKLRLLDFIEENVRIITKDGGVCDLFAGSGCVTYRLSRLFPVISCDIQSYSKVICNALLDVQDITASEIDDFRENVNSQQTILLNTFLPLITIEEEAIRKKDLSVLTEILEYGSVEVFRQESARSSLSEAQIRVLNNLKDIQAMNCKSLISRYYGGVYFSYRQAVQIDSILEVINSQNFARHKDLLLAALLSTASDIVDTVGKHFAQPIKARDSKGNIKTFVYSKAEEDKTIDVIPLYESWLNNYIHLPKTKFKHLTIKGDYMDCLRNLPDNIKTIYADPPYTRDHYSRFYHVLETIALDDEPEISTVKIHGTSHISNGIYRKDRYQSPFCIRSKAPDAFKKMFKEISASNRNLLLSYSPYDETKKTQPRVVTMRQLVSWAKEYFNNVETISAGHFTHNKLNSTEHLLESSEEAEALIICTNN